MKKSLPATGENAHRHSTRQVSSAPRVVRILDVPEPGLARVLLPDQSERQARMTATIASRPPSGLLGREALALFDEGDPERPVLIDLIGAPEGFADTVEIDDGDEADALDARIDGEQVVIQARERLELRCGKASIIIDAEGKISIKGAHLYNRATGPIRIKGGHVDIN
ncbi:MAG: hypothetical protein AAGH19_08890 [Pseudomonadota bacterium]